MGKNEIELAEHPIDFVIQLKLLYRLISKTIPTTELLIILFYVTTATSEELFVK